MTNEVREALEIILQSCLKEDSCKECPMAEICGKIPCEWDSLLIEE